VIRAFDAFSLPLLRWFDPEDAHRMAIQGLRLLPPMRARAGRFETGGARLRAEFSQSDRHGAGSTRARRRPTRCCGWVLVSSRSAR
jgi:hypothetical protein